MKVFVAGGSGAIGMRLVPRLLAERHEVVAVTRSKAKAGRLRALGAEAVLADALHRGAVVQAVMRVEPEVVIHQLRRRREHSVGSPRAVMLSFGEDALVAVLSNRDR